MKRIFAVILMLSMLFCTSGFVYATDNDKRSDSIIFDDGSFIVIILDDTQIRASETKSGTKTYSYYSSDGENLWKAVLSGTFTYTGSTAACTSSSCNVTIYNSSWFVSSKTSNKIGNTATADLTMVRKLLGITVDTKEVYMSLSCDVNGNLS